MKPTKEQAARLIALIEDGCSIEEFKEELAQVRKELELQALPHEGRVIVMREYFNKNLK